MVLCKSCKKKDKREYADDCFACDKGDQWEAKRHRSTNKTKTYADRIRKMTDEELAEWFAGHDAGLVANVLNNDYVEPTKDGWLEWLETGV